MTSHDDGDVTVSAGLGGGPAVYRGNVTGVLYREIGSDPGVAMALAAAVCYCVEKQRYCAALISPVLDYSPILYEATEEWIK